MSDDEKSVENDDAASSTSNSDNENSYRLDNSSINDSDEDEEEEEIYSDDEKDINILESTNSAPKQDNTVSDLYHGNHADSEEDEDDDDNDDVLQKFNNINKMDYVSQAHPECLPDNYEEIISLTKVGFVSSSSVNFFILIKFLDF